MEFSNFLIKSAGFSRTCVTIYRSSLKVAAYTMKRKPSTVPARVLSESALCKLVEMYSKYYGPTDRYFPVFEQIKQRVGQASRVLYPGCYVHITPSKLFQSVVYVDEFKGRNDSMSKFFASKGVLSSLLSDYESIEVKYHQCNYKDKLDEPESSFDVLISLDAGFITKYCVKYLKLGGLVVANDGHADASLASTNSHLALIGYMEKDPEGELEWVDDQASLDAMFLLKKTGEKITEDEVLANGKVGMSSWPNKHKLQKGKSIFVYIFKRIN